MIQPIQFDANAAPTFILANALFQYQVYINMNLRRDKSYEYLSLIAHLTLLITKF